ncbi:MAG TPA: hypothetical protein VGO11_15135 [Chthoniobacteraceae bacterium]|jgi:hypothetical protein|nr:hypothetical protein [Chthoniobacteraceae bacterium]
MNRELPEELAGLLAAIGEAPGLRAWFLALHDLSPAARSLALGRMAMEMRAGGEERTLIAAVVALETPAVYEAAYRTVIELYGS